MLRLVFMGSDAIALPVLNWLANSQASGAQILTVFTQPDRAAGRGQKVRPNEIKQWATARNIPVLQPAKLDAAEKKELERLKPDLVLVMAYGHILRQEFIDEPALGTLNLHTSILPAYRGASPIQTAIACGERETGVSLMRLVPRLDAGPVADVERVPIGPLDTAVELEVRLGLACVPLMMRCLPQIAARAQPYRNQVESGATFCRRLEKSDGVLDFSAGASALAARINGLAAWPGCSFEADGQTIKVGLADRLPGEGSPGKIMGTDAEGLLVGTGEGLLRMRKLQRPGGRMLAAGEFLRGFPIKVGQQLPSRPMPPLVSREPFPRRPAPRSD